MNRDVLKNLAVAGGIIVLALIASFARSRGVIDQDTTTRIVIVAIGLMIVWQGNRIPKTFVAGAGARKAQRVAAWSMVLGGLVYTAAFAVLPLDLAVVVGCGAIVAAMVVTFAYCLRLRARTNRAA